MATRVEDFVHVQVATFNAAVRSRGGNTQFVSRLDQSSAELAQQRLAVKASAAWLTRNPVL